VEITNGAYGSRFIGGYRSDLDDITRDGKFLDTPDRRVDGNMYYSSFGSDKYRGHHPYHPYKRSDRGYFPYEFKKENPPTFDEEVKKTQDVEAYLLGMNKFLRLQDYSENMKVRIDTFSIKGKHYPLLGILIQMV